jgi:hypothetical protein
LSPESIAPDARPSRTLAATTTGNDGATLYPARATADRIVLQDNNQPMCVRARMCPVMVLDNTEAAMAKNRSSPNAPRGW